MSTARACVTIVAVKTIIDVPHKMLIFAVFFDIFFLVWIRLYIYAVCQLFQVAATESIMWVRNNSEFYCNSACYLIKTNARDSLYFMSIVIFYYIYSIIHTHSGLCVWVFYARNACS